ncbi:receptor-type tyrosine-protein phosphatase beta-like [Sardina pilchardus]|uniref:receptor-type tyrosine-protein phosphatase beta-like n=1 Tax=Sardina pilchardus TaxID=27697 RepID=UPI002E11EFDB
METQLKLKLLWLCLMCAAPILGLRLQPFISKQSNNSITVAWSAPDGNVESHVVLLNSSSSNKSPELDSSITSYEFQNLTAGKIYSATVTTQSGNFSEDSEPVTNATYPNPPGHISLKHATTDSIFIEWAPAHLMEDADNYCYTVTISTSSGTREYNTKSTYQNLTDLTAGTFHDVSVRTIGPFGLQSESIDMKYVTTRPNVVQPFISKQSSNSIRVVWRAPDGNVGSYVVFLNSSSSSNRSPELDSSITSYEFQNLAAGKIYTVTVTTRSGNLSEESEPVTNATYPNPPGSIKVNHTTTNSIFIEWAPAHLMDDTDNFSYTVTISNSSWTREYKAKTTSQNMTNLTAGTFFNIFVRTIGPFGLQSECFKMEYVTRPNVVQPFISKQSSNSIRVVWRAPDGNVGSYVVLLNSSSSSSSRSPELDSSITSYEFQNLAAGKIYTVTVITQSGNFSEESEPVTNATYPNPPGSIKVKHTTTNSIFIEWAPAHLMDDTDNFSYTVTISNSSWTREYKQERFTTYL